MGAAGFDLALETSRREASLALGTDALVMEETLGERAHASDLLPRLAEVLARAGVPWPGTGPPLRALFVGLGPGSYTGLRVGIATAQGLARASGAALYGLSSFEALAYATLACGEEGTVAMDARAGRFYHARYRRTETGLEVLEAPSALTAAELAGRCAAGGVLLGHPGLAEAAGLAAAPAARMRTDALPSARALLALGRARVAAGTLARAEALEPLYLAEFGARPRADSAGRAGEGR